MALVFLKNRPRPVSSFHPAAKRSTKKSKLFYFLFGFVAVWLIFFLTPPLHRWAAKFLTSEKLVALTQTGPTVKSDHGRTNILLLGTGGGVHEGPDLSDTMIVASVDLKTKNSQLISIPRDTWVPSQASKINASYAFGREKGDGWGLKQAKGAVSQLLGIPVHYGVRLDFAGFTRAVDLVGGLDIDVARRFDDYAYPVLGKENDLCGKHYETVEATPGASPEAKPYVIKDATGSVYPDEPETFSCRFEYLHFEAGQQHMDGSKALKYVRSRHAEGDEGNDFARSARQEKVIIAFKQKVFSTQTFLNPKKVLDLIGTFRDSIDTDINPTEVTQFVRLAGDAKEAQISTYTLDAAKRDSLMTVGDPANFGGQYVLVPKDSNRLKDFINNTLFPSDK